MKGLTETTGTAKQRATPPERGPLEWARWVPAVCITILIITVLAISASVVFFPFLISITLAYLLAPYVKWFEQRGWSRPTSVLLILILLGLLLVLALIVILPSVWGQLHNSYQQALELFAHPQKAAPLLSRIKQIIPTVYANYIDSLWERTAARLYHTNLSEFVLNWLQSGLFQLVNYTTSLFDLLLVPFFVYYLLTTYRAMRTRFETLIPSRWRPQVLELTNQINLVLLSYVRGQLLIALIMSSLYVIGFVLLRVPIAMTLGIVSGLLNFIPYIGTLSGLALSLIFLILDGAGVARLLGVVAVFVLVQSLEGYFLTPRLLGGRLNLSPLWVLLGLLIGGNLFGLIGIVLALPVLAISKVLLGFLEAIYHQSDFYCRTTPSLILEPTISHEATADLARQNRTRPLDVIEHNPRLIVTLSELTSRHREPPS